MNLHFFKPSQTFISFGHDRQNVPKNFGHDSLTVTNYSGHVSGFVTKNAPKTGDSSHVLQGVTKNFGHIGPIGTRQLVVLRGGLGHTSPNVTN